MNLVNTLASSGFHAVLTVTALLLLGSIRPPSTRDVTPRQVRAAVRRAGALRTALVIVTLAAGLALVLTADVARLVQLCARLGRAACTVTADLLTALVFRPSRRVVRA